MKTILPVMQFAVNITNHTRRYNIFPNLTNTKTFLIHFTKSTSLYRVPVDVLEREKKINRIHTKTFQSIILVYVTLHAIRFKLWLLFRAKRSDTHLKLVISCYMLDKTVFWNLTDSILPFKFKILMVNSPKIQRKE